MSVWKYIAPQSVCQDQKRPQGLPGAKEELEWTGGLEWMNKYIQQKHICQVHPSDDSRLISRR